MSKKWLSAIVAFIVCVIASDLRAQAINTGVGVGFQIGQYQRDFGIGVNVTSPYFALDRIGVRLRANLVFNESVQNSATTWIPYSNASLGLIGVGGMVAESIRLYGEGGFVGLFPSDEFSSQQFHFGGYGVFGFEFFMSSGVNYFIEIGGIGTGAKADLLPSQPIYSNGLMINAGVRFFGK